jgi:hypothetical protein
MTDLPDDEYEGLETIAPGAFDAHIGKSVPVTDAAGRVIGHAVVVGSDDEQDGSGES